jgi:excisionase family DNA binding protein
MEQHFKTPNTLWKYSDLAHYLQVSANRLRRDVMNRKIPFIKIGRSVRFDKNQIAKFLKIEIREDNKPQPVALPIKEPRLNSINDIAAWLHEKSTLYPYAEINVRVIVHDGRVQRFERTVMEKIQVK